MALAYRADLQGLRGLSIILVVLAHAGMPGVSGGFVGVDVFFVLSGYLITGLLLGEYRASQRINWGAFIARRLRRLLPALLVMLLGVMGLAAILLSTHEFTEQTSSVAYAATWTSNLFFAFSTIDYFAELRRQDLFLHTWSLGVEEQFYLIWPWVLGGMFWLRRKSCGSKDQARWLAWAFGSCVIVGLALSLYWSFNHYLWGFYLMPSRIWEFALGALVFTLLDSGHARTTHDAAVIAPAYAPWLAAGGAAAILGSAVLLDSNVTYPGYWAIVPALGAALVIAAGSLHRRNVVSTLLAGRVPVWIGDRSYSWYLWHWPLLMLGGAYGLTKVPTAQAALVVLSLLVAALSYRKVELPIWKGRFSSLPSRLTLASGTVAIAFVATVLANAQMVGRESDERGRQLVLRTYTDTPEVYSGGDCDSWHRDAELNPCVFGNPQGDKTVVLIGDSVGTQWFSALPGMFTGDQWRIVVLTKSACAIVDEDYFYDVVGDTFDVCRQWRDKALGYIDDNKPDAVVMGSAMSYPFDQRQWVDGTRRVLARINRAVGRIIVLAGTPALTFDGPGCLERWISDHDFDATPDSSVCSEPLTDARVTSVAGYLHRAVASYPNATVLDLTDIVCPGGRCGAFSDDGMVVFRDRQHLTDSFVRARTPSVARRFAALGDDRSATPGGEQGLDRQAGLLGQAAVGRPGRNRP